MTTTQKLLSGSAAVVALGLLGYGLSASVKTVAPAETVAAVTAPPAVFMSPTGNDSTCARLGAPCVTPDRAAAIAQSGDVIQVAAGIYPAGAPSYGYVNYILHSTPVTYVCAPGAAADSVSFVDTGFLIGPGGGNVTFQGSCFHFHILVIGLRGYSGAGNRVSNVTVDGVHMDAFDITGAQNVTVENSQVGPIDACFADAAQAASYGAPASAACDPANPTEAFWASAGGTLNLQDEPFVHNNGSDVAQNVHFLSDHFTGMQTKWPTVFHQGGLLIWGTDGTQIVNTVFDHNAIYNIEFNAGTTETNGLWQGDSLNPAVYTLADGANSGLPLPAEQCQEGASEATSSWSTYTFTGNTFSQCFNIGAAGSYSGVQFTNNTIGPFANCTPNAGITYSGNTSGGQPVCGGSTTTTSTTSTTTTTTTPAPNVPLAITELTFTLNWMHAPRSVGGLNYSVSQVRLTHAYKAMVALGGSWP